MANVSELDQSTALIRLACRRYSGHRRRCLHIQLVCSTLNQTYFLLLLGQCGLARFTENVFNSFDSFLLHFHIGIFYMCACIHRRYQAMVAFESENTFRFIWLCAFFAKLCHFDAIQTVDDRSEIQIEFQQHELSSPFNVSQFLFWN